MIKAENKEKGCVKRFEETNDLTCFGIEPDMSLYSSDDEVIEYETDKVVLKDLKGFLHIVPPCRIFYRCF